MAQSLEPRATPQTSLGRSLAQLGANVLHQATQVGGMTLLLLRIVRNLLPLRMDGVEFARHLYRMGVQSVAIVAATAAFVGAIMVIQSAPLVERFNVVELVGWASGFAILREVGPLLIALMFNGRVGANNAADLATMQVTDQVDGLRALAIEPMPYLIMPRCVAMVIMLVVLTIVGDAVAITGATFASYLLLDVDPRAFFHSFTTLLNEWDFLTGIAKSGVFGLMIAVTSCHFGMNVEGGAKGVGRAVNAAVVAAASGIFLMDYFATFVLN